MKKMKKWGGAIALCLALLVGCACAADENGKMVFTAGKSESGAGYAWDGATNTLTLTNFKGAYPDLFMIEYALSFHIGGEIATIRLEGDNEIEIPEDNSVGAIDAGGLHITGDGSLRVKDGGIHLGFSITPLTIDGGARVQADAGLQAENITISGAGTQVSVLSYGITAANTLTIDGAAVHVTSGEVCAFGEPWDNTTPPTTPMIIRNATVTKGGAVQNVIYTNENVKTELYGASLHGAAIAPALFKVIDGDFELANTEIEITPQTSGGAQGATKPETTTPDTSSSGLRDISGHWAQSDIEKLVSTGIVNGYEDGTFRPEAPVTRAEIAKMVFLAAPKFGYPIAQSDTVLIKEAQSSWAAPYINHLAASAIIDRTDYTNGYIADGYATRFEVVKMIVRAHKMQNDLSIVKSQYTDVRDIETIFYAEKARELGIATGNPDGTFSPLKNISRAEAATMLVRAMIIV